MDETKFWLDFSLYVHDSPYRDAWYGWAMTYAIQNYPGTMLGY